MTNVTYEKQNMLDSVLAMSSFSAEELLSCLLERDNLNAGDVQEIMAQKRKEQLLKNHTHKIWQGSDGRWRTFIPDDTKPKNRKLISRETKASLEDYICSFYKEYVDPYFDKDTTLRDLYDEWIEYKSLHVAETTVLRVQKDWRKYYQDADITGKPIAEITKLELDSWVHKMIREHHMTKHKYGNFSLIIRQMLDFAVDKEIIESNPFLRVKVDKKRVLKPEPKKNDLSQVYTKEEEQRLIEHAREAFDNTENYVQFFVPLAIMFMFYTGLRLGEVSVLKFSDVESNMLNVNRMVRYPTGEIVEHTKGTFGERIIPLIPAALEIIELASKRREALEMDTDGYIFCPNNRPINTYTSIQKTITKYCRELGIEEKSPHKVRKTVVSTMLDNGININTVRNIVGHMDEKTTLNNYCYDRSTDDEKYKLITKALS